MNDNQLKNQLELDELTKRINKMDFKINELDRDTLRQWFIWCSSNNIKLKADYTEFIKLNNL